MSADVDARKRSLGSLQKFPGGIPMFQNILIVLAGLFCFGLITWRLVVDPRNQHANRLVQNVVLMIAAPFVYWAWKHQLHIHPAAGWIALFCVVGAPSIVALIVEIKRPSKKTAHQPSRSRSGYPQQQHHARRTIQRDLSCDIPPEVQQPPIP
jgi:hypothetical protein